MAMRYYNEKGLVRFKSAFDDTFEIDPTNPDCKSKFESRLAGYADSDMFKDYLANNSELVYNKNNFY